ncbi:MAG: tetratricopeptide repeat protein [Flavobacteriales bacterium]
MRYIILVILLIFSLLPSFSVAQSCEEMIAEYERLLGNKKYEKADELVDQMLLKFPDYAFLHIRKAESLGMNGEWIQSFEVLDNAISIFPDTLFLYVTTANLYVEFKALDKAIPYFGKALEKSTTSLDSVDILTFRGGVHSMNRDLTKAKVDLELALSIDPKNINTLNNLSAIFQEVGDFDKSIDILEQILEIEPEYMPAIVNLGFTLQQDEKHDEALVYFDQAVKLSPDEPLAYSNRSFSRLKTDDLKGAMSDVDKSLELYATNSWAMKIKGLIYVERKKFDKACEQFYMAKEFKYTEHYGPEVDELIKGFCLD